MLVPNAALAYAGSAGTVSVLQNGVATPVRVQTGITDGVSTQVVSGGVAAGALVAGRAPILPWTAIALSFGVSAAIGCSSASIQRAKHPSSTRSSHSATNEPREIDSPLRQSGRAPLQ